MSPVIAPSRLPDPLPKQILSSPVVSPDKLRFKAGESRRPLQSPPDVGLSTRNYQPHPLSRPPITASAEQSLLNTPVEAPSPLPIISAAPAQVAAMRRGLHRRRSSFPPAVGSTVTGANNYPWVVGGTPPASKIGPPTGDALSGYGNEIGPFSNGISSPAAWESLLNFDNFESGTKSNPPFEATFALEGDTVVSTSPKNKLLTPKKGFGLERTASNSEAWRLALNRTVEVEGVGQVGVARILSEVWKRGGPAAVTSQGLWPNVLMSLSLATGGSNVHVGTPSASAALSLQALYNVAARPHETNVFAGLLSNYVASTAPLVVNAFQDGQVYGAWTPTKGLSEELSQWTTFTPGEEWPSLSTTLPSGSGLTPRREFSPALGLPPIDISDPLDTVPRPGSRGAGDAMTGIDAILAEMEEDERIRESQSVSSSAGPSQPEWTKSNSTAQASTQASPATVVTPTENDPFVTRAGTSSNAEEPVEYMISSPFVSGGSMLSSATSASTNIPTVSPETAQTAGTVIAMRGPRPRAPTLQLPLPDVPFIPPPPMCMFFSPSFRDLQEGKVAVWKGDLTIRGRGGGRFNVLIIGEAASGHLWKSHTWPEALTYPSGPAMTESCTATMIPVSTLAREGLLPVTMGMVLCNDENIAPFVNMVQGLHAEGVAFHLPMPDTTLPIVFLPAKFDSADPLQRLGIAFMTKGGVPPNAPPVPPSRKSSTEDDLDSAPERKRRRKSTVSNGDSKSTPRRNVPVRPKVAKNKN
ncbi:hypothetical protein CC85DRAFT_135026 [Cutaneotrichosporon oleaginosum]|uniref:Uncharacterized protein n=1 Tax=Cutaneotrichosporon oleaginosum TaxID=879819 RepID=A0A0J0XWL7_9TREE|nr:uncharacterized protein CC85DRAFT_135026 [Cutaneotrichosporon oleaginosum]KLT45443.1 hypothetical protein CC85DRAFT_135026 [Cutaneotrichosporon oleaginosum]TXT14597.1 hypothetical protein COLE_00790 [Cutaneotrichosporon oleaginosum]